MNILLGFVQLDNCYIVLENQENCYVSSKDFYDFNENGGTMMKLIDIELSIPINSNQLC